MIRDALAHDLIPLVELGRRMHAEAPMYRDFGYDEDKVFALLARVQREGFLMVSELDGQIVGGFAGILVENWFSRDKVASEVAIFLDSAYRGGTTALRLVSAFVAWSKARGARRVSMGVTTGVHAERTGALFVACGFAHTGGLYSMDIPVPVDAAPQAITEHV